MANQVQKHRPIGFHVSPEINITFIASGQDKVEAVVSDVKDPAPVELPEVSPPTSSVDFSTTAKVIRLLRNCHLQPSYSIQKGQKTGAVSFIPINPENKTWEKCDEIELQDKDSPCFFRSDGTLCYAFVNTVTTWDWKNHNFTTTSFKTGYITALAELQDGRLIVGDDKGNLLLQGDPQPLLSDKKDDIKAIVAITSTCYLIKFKNKTAVILNTQNRQVIKELDSCLDFFVLKKNVFGFLKNKKLILFQINENKCKEMEHSFKDKNISGVKAVSDNTLLLVPITEKSEKESIIIWNFEKNSWKEYKDDFLQAKAQQKNLIFIDGETFACPSDRDTAIVFYSAEKQEFKAAEAAGNWGVSTLIPLSDGSIMYATHTSPSGIHAVTKNGKVTFTNTALAQNRLVESMRELEDGAVAIKFPKAMMIIRPQMKKTESNAYKIEKCLLELRHNPSQLDLYEKLAQFYKENPEKRYQTYLAGLEAAIKGNQLYQARRYYEKARKIKPDIEEPSRLFMSYLENSGHIKQKTQVALDLYHVQSKTNPSAQLLKFLDKAKKCKERLFVGEGDFSFTEALIKKHQKTHSRLAMSITATELGYLVDNSEEKGPDNNTPKRILRLHDKGVKVLFGIDGQNLHQIFKGKRFKRIHWNCPFVDFNKSNIDEFKKVTSEFFKSCSHLQLTKDRVHLTLMQEKDGYWKIRQGQIPIVKGATLAGYRLIRKRVFGAGRYPEYEHVKTDKDPHGKNEGMREFVFEKAETIFSLKEATHLPDRAHELKNSEEKKYKIKTDTKKPSDTDYYFECSSDEDSSDYYESDTEPVTP